MKDVEILCRYQKKSNWNPDGSPSRDDDYYMVAHVVTGRTPYEIQTSLSNMQGLTDDEERSSGEIRRLFGSKDYTESTLEYVRVLSEVGHPVTSRAGVQALPVEGLRIEGITLLSKEEYRAFQDNIPPLDGWWWLRSPGNFGDYASSVRNSVLYPDGSRVDYSDGPVHPALKIMNFNSMNLKIRDPFRLAGYTWTVISEDTALCDEAVGKSAFRKDWRAKDANNYELSDVKKWLENWTAENNIICKGTQLSITHD